MKNENRIRKNPVFELYIENNMLIIYDADNVKDSCEINSIDVISVNLIKYNSVLDKIIAGFFGFNYPKKSNEIRIVTKSGAKNIILTNCEMDKVIVQINKINQIILNINSKF